MKWNKPGFILQVLRAKERGFFEHDKKRDQTVINRNNLEENVF